MPRLPFHNLAERHPGLTPAVGDYLTEAARVCLDRHHVSPVDFEIDNHGSKTSAVAEWEPVNDRAKGAHANETDATEAGAYACALAAVEIAAGLVAVHRAETRTGADYYVASPGVSPEDLESCIRLEISGVDRGSVATVAGRLRVKLEQCSAGYSNLPAMAGVVGFKAKLIMLGALEKS